MKNITFGRWLEEYINVYKKPFVKSIKNHKIIIRLHVPEYLKKQKLSLINAFEIQKALNNVTNSRTRQDVFNLYNGALTTAYKLGLTERNLADLLIKPIHKRQVGSALTEAELNEFLCNIEKTACKNYFLFLLYSGCRRQEALDLTWSDVDFDRKMIHIRGTKTELSDRWIPLLPKAEELLLSITIKGNKIFHHRADFVSHTFKKICPAHKLHDLRHTFATRCIECDIDIQVVQKWLGHSRLDTTASIYTHIRESFSLEESKKFKL